MRRVCLRAFESFTAYYLLAAYCLFIHLFICLQQTFCFLCCFNWRKGFYYYYYYYYYYFSIVFIPMVWFREVFLWKTIIHFLLLNIFCKALLMFIMCLCLLITSLVFGNERFYVTEKRIMLAQIGLAFYKSELLSRFSTLVIWLWMLASL